MIVTGWEHWDELVTWCQVNVGVLLWSQPIIEWHGQGWHIRRVAKGFEVTIEDEKLLILAMLKWA